MPRHTDWFLVELERKLSPDVDLTSRLEMVNELASHVECQRASFEELGMGPDEADRCAVESLGEPATIARKLIRELQEDTGQRNVFSGRVALIASIAALWVGVWLWVNDWHLEMIAFAWVLPALGVWLLVESARNVRWQVKTIGLVCASWAVLMTFVFSLTWVISPHGAVEVPRRQLASRMAGWNLRIQSDRELLSNLRGAATAFHMGLPSFDPVHEFSYPVGTYLSRRSDGLSREVVWKNAASDEELVRGWSDFEQFGYQQLEQESQRSQDYLRQARLSERTSPIRRLAPSARYVLPFALAGSIPMFGISLLGFGIGLAGRRLKRSRRRGPVMA